jgi:hypothetical protein
MPQQRSRHPLIQLSYTLNRWQLATLAAIHHRIASSLALKHMPTRFPANTRTWVLQLLHGGLPVAISITTQPSDQISAGRPWPVCLITSGAIQYGVPRMLLLPVPTVARSSMRRLAPKSASFTVPLQNKQAAGGGHRSRCAMCALC